MQQKLHDADRCHLRITYHYPTDISPALARLTAGLRAKIGEGSSGGLIGGDGAAPTCRSAMPLGSRHASGAAILSAWKWRGGHLTRALAAANAPCNSASAQDGG